MFEIATIMVIVLFVFIVICLAFTSYKIYDGVTGLFRADPQPVPVAAPATKTHVSGRPLTQFEKDTEAELQMVNDAVIGIVAGARSEWDKLKECCSRDGVVEETAGKSVEPLPSTHVVAVDFVDATVFAAAASHPTGEPRGHIYRPYIKEGRVHYASCGTAFNEAMNVTQAHETLSRIRIAVDAEREALCLTLLRLIERGHGDCLVR